MRKVRAAFQSFKNRQKAFSVVKNSVLADLAPPSVLIGPAVLTGSTVLIGLAALDDICASRKNSFRDILKPLSPFVPVVSV